MRYNFGFCLLLISCLISHCVRDAGQPKGHERAVELWKGHEADFAKAIRDGVKDDSFEISCLFFERLTGIELHVNIWTFGVLPTPATPGDLVALRAWYAKNGDRLYWDEESDSVKVVPY